MVSGLYVSRVAWMGDVDNPKSRDEMETGGWLTKKGKPKGKAGRGSTSGLRVVEEEAAKRRSWAARII